MSERIDSNWTESEFCSIILPDERLSNRFQLIAKELASLPQAPINQASLNVASAKGAYRFFNNEKVTWNKIIEPHLEATAVRAFCEDKILIAQDTSYLDFSSHESVEDLGDSFENHGKTIKGICFHAGLAMSPTGLPLGQIFQKQWNRTQINKDKPNHYRSMIPIEQLESWRWIECMEESRILIPDKQLIHVGDREADVFELFQIANELEVDVVIRSNYDRVTTQNGFLFHLSEELKSVTKTKEIIVSIPSNGSRLAREAILEVRYKQIELESCPSGIKTKRNERRKNTHLFVVEAKEMNPAKGIKPLSWRLLTSLEVNNFEDAVEVVKIYRMRWNIELYFKTLKSGCTIEECRLGTSSALMNYIALMSVVAWRLFWLTTAERTFPEMSCEVAFKESEWKAAWLLINRAKIKNGTIKAEPPLTPPTLSEATRWIGMLGGFLGRKGDKKPGIKAIWQGWERLSGAVDVYECLQK